MNMTQASYIFSDPKFVYRNLMPYKGTIEPGLIVRKLAVPVAPPSEQIRAAFRRNYLYRHLIHNDYYCENGTLPGTWIGAGAQRLGFEPLSRPVTRPPSPQAVSSSIRTLTMGDDRLIAAHEAAVTIAYKELEAIALKKATARKRSGRRA